MGYADTALAIWEECVKTKPPLVAKIEKGAKKCEVIAPEAPSGRGFDPLYTLAIVHKTPWNTLAWSDPAAPEIEAFGETPPECATPDGPVSYDPLPEASPRPWRSELPRWSVPWRQRWGELANELAESGTPWPDDERIAFQQVLTERRQRAESLGITTTATATGETSPQ